MAQKLLDAVLTTGTSSSISFTRVCEDWTVQLKHTGSPTSVILDLEGSINGVDYVQIGQHTATAADDMFHVDGKACRKVRLNLTTLSGGTNPTVTAWVEAKEIY